MTPELPNQAPGLDGLVDDILQAVIKRTNAERGYLALFEGGDTLQVRAAHEIDYEDLQKDAYIATRNVVNRVASSGEPLVTTNAQHDPRFTSAGSIAAYALRSILCLPLATPGVFLGIIYVDRRIRYGMYKDEDLDRLADLIRQAGADVARALDAGG